MCNGEIVFLLFTEKRRFDSIEEFKNIQRCSVGWIKSLKCGHRSLRNSRNDAPGQDKQS